MNKITMVVIQGDAKKTKLMQSLDVFEKWKVLGELFTITVDLKDDVELISKLEKVRNATLANSDMIISLIWIPELPDIAPYIRNDVKVISTGKSWTRFTDSLTKLGVPHRCNEQLFCSTIQN